MVDSMIANLNPFLSPLSPGEACGLAQAFGVLLCARTLKFSKRSQTVVHAAMGIASDIAQVLISLQNMLCVFNTLLLNLNPFILQFVDVFSLDPPELWTVDAWQRSSTATASKHYAYLFFLERCFMRKG
jgi:hypothetical protein